MLNWISNAVSSVAEWLGSGVGKFVEWILGGLSDVFSPILDAAGGLWDLIDSLWNFAAGFFGSITGLVGVLFPFIPAPVATVIELGLLAVLIAGIVKAVKK